MPCNPASCPLLAAPLAGAPACPSSSGLAPEVLGASSGCGGGGGGISSPVVAPMAWARPPSLPPPPRPLPSHTRRRRRLACERTCARMPSRTLSRTGSPARSGKVRSNAVTAAAAACRQSQANVIGTQTTTNAQVNEYVSSCTDMSMHAECRQHTAASYGRAADNSQRCVLHLREPEHKQRLHAEQRCPRRPLYCAFHRTTATAWHCPGSLTVCQRRPGIASPVSCLVQKSGHESGVRLTPQTCCCASHPGQCSCLAAIARNR